MNGIVVAHVRDRDRMGGLYRNGMAHPVCRRQVLPDATAFLRSIARVQGWCRDTTFWVSPKPYEPRIQANDFAIYGGMPVLSYPSSTGRK
jgi:hypothetical protein